MAQPQVLIVASEESVIAAVQACVEKLGCEVTGTATSSEDAVQSVFAPEPEVAIFDLDVPAGVDGLQAASAVAAHFKVPLVLLAGRVDRELVERAKAIAPDGYLTKPVLEQAALPVLHVALHRRQLEKQPVQDASGLAEATVDGTVKTFVEILASVSPTSYQQGQKLRASMARLAEWLKRPEKLELEYAAALYQIGYLSIPPTLVQKLRAGLKLTSYEQTMVTSIPDLSRKLLARIPPLESVAQMVYYQNKNFDGTGFPTDDVAGANIPLGARLLRIVMDLVEMLDLGTADSRVGVEMRKYAERYDPELLKEAIACLVEAPPPGSIPLQARELKAGLKVLASIETQEGELIASPGTQITAELLKRLSHLSGLNKLKEPIYVAGSARP